MTKRQRELTRAPGSWRRFVAAVAALAVVAVGIPLGLVAVSRLTLGAWHPIPGVGSLEEIRTWLSRDLSSSEIVPVALRLLLGAAWLLWLGLLMSVLSSIVTSRPSLERVRLPRLAMFDGLGGWIAAGLTALSSLTPNVAHATVGESLPAIEVVEPARPPAARHTARPVTGRAGWERVEHGESIEMFAARTLGDPGRWEEIWALNEGRVIDESGATWTEPWRLGAGWELEVPVTRSASPASSTDPPATAAGPPELHLVVTDHRSDDGAAMNGHVVDLGVIPVSAFVVEVPSPPPPSTPPAQYVVADGDSYWRIAEATLRADIGREPTGAEVLVRTHELIAGNAARLGDVDDPHMLHTGDIVDLTAAPLPVMAAAAAGSSVEYVVQDGDSYWRIAERTLPLELGREPTKAEVLDYTYELIDHNAARLGDADDPHMLHTGDVVYLRDPAAPTLPPSAAATPPSAPPAAPPAPVPAAQEPASAPPVTDPAPPRDPVEAAPVPTPATIPPVKSPFPAAQPAAAPQPRAAESAGPGVPAGRVLAGMSAVAFAGLAAAWALRRSRANQRARPHQRPAPVAERNCDAVTEVVYRDISAVTWMAAELRLLAHHLPAEVRSSLTVQLVQLDAHGLEVAFVEIPAGAPPAGWCAAAERVWRLNSRHDPAELSAVAEAPPVLPALATLGDPSGSQLFLNLEAVAGVNVTGDETVVAAWLAGVVWELAGGALSERPSVVLVDVDVAGADQLPGVSRMTGPDALAALTADHATAGGAMLQRRVNEWEAWPPTLVIIDAANVDAAWADVAARPSVAVVVVNGSLPGGLDVELRDGELTVPAWRLRIPATVLDESTVTAAIDVLRAADDDPIVDDLTIAAHTPGTPLHAADDDDWESPTWPVMVHVLGEPFATRNGERLALSPQRLSVLAYLAVTRDASIDELTEAMWGGETVPKHRIRDLLSDTRTAAGGESVVAHAEDGRVRAGPDLGSDLALFEALNTRAQEAPAELAARMREIMHLVRGVPFSHASSVAQLWRWVDHPKIDLRAQWSLRSSTVAWELAGLYLDRRDAGAARDIAERGLIADPLNAALTERLMEAYAAVNAVEAAQRVYESHDRALAARGMDGAAENTRLLLERILAEHRGTVGAAVGS